MMFPPMTPQDLAEEVGHFIRSCQGRVTGIGAEQYSVEGQPQRFETMPFDDLAEYYHEELLDLANYACMTSIRLGRLRRAILGPANRPTIVCLCGSGRFREAFEQAEFSETIAGKIVLTIGCNTKDVARDQDLSHHKPMLDQLHLRKIDLADEVLILNVNDYVGESTTRELDYARQHGKRVVWFEESRYASCGEQVWGQ